MKTKIIKSGIILISIVFCTPSYSQNQLNRANEIMQKKRVTVDQGQLTAERAEERRKEAMNINSSKGEPKKANQTIDFSGHMQILKKFEEWKGIQYYKGVYVPPNKCNIEAIINGDIEDGQGIPSEYKIFYDDINDDNKIDALITFQPNSCGGGNALMNVEIKVLILSNGLNYIVDEQYFNNIENTFNEGWIFINGLSGSDFYGTYYNYEEGDARCCPTIKRPINIDYKTSSLTFNNQ